MCYTGNFVNCFNKTHKSFGRKPLNIQSDRFGCLEVFYGNFYVLLNQLTNSQYKASNGLSTEAIT